MSEYIQHSSHPDHQLQLICDNKGYSCACCEEPGWGARYSCEKCNFHLDRYCAFAVPRMSHMFYRRRKFSLLPPAVHGNLDAYCVACEKLALGLVYYCAKEKCYLHPSCAYLPICIVDEGSGHKLELHERLSGKCERCGRDDKSWSYRNKKKNIHFHISCVIDMALRKREKLYLGEIGIQETSLAPDLQLTRSRGSTSMAESVSKLAKTMRDLFLLTITEDPSDKAIVLFRSGIRTK